MSINLANTLDSLQQLGGLETSVEVHVFRGYRMDSQGYKREIKVEVEDRGYRGFEADQQRYFIIAMTIDEGEPKKATGNGGATIEEALTVLHWQDLD